MHKYVGVKIRYRLGYCYNDGICVRSASSGGAHEIECVCPAGFGGPRCGDDWCHRNGDHCLNGGEHFHAFLFVIQRFITHIYAAYHFIT